METKLAIMLRGLILANELPPSRLADITACLEEIDAQFLKLQRNYAVLSDSSQRDRELMERTAKTLMPRPDAENLELVRWFKSFRNSCKSVAVDAAQRRVDSATAALQNFRAVLKDAGVNVNDRLAQGKLRPTRLVQAKQEAEDALRAIVDSDPLTTDLY